MDPKLLNEFLQKYNDDHGSSISFGEWMYYQGCAAQSIEDIKAFKKATAEHYWHSMTKTDYPAMCDYIAAAAIV